MSAWDADRARESMREIMRKRNTNVKRWAEKAGLTDSTFRNFMSGAAKSMTLEKAAELAAAENLSISEMIGETPQQTYDNINLDLLRQIIEAVETFCQEEEIQLPPDRLAQLILMLYATPKPSESAPFTLSPEMRNVVLLSRRRN